MYTFKANSSRSNVKRFLTQTAKVDPATVDLYITQQTDAGKLQWGTFTDKAGKPVPFADVAVVVQGKIDALRPAPPAPPVAALDPRVSPWGSAPAAAPATEVNEPEPVDGTGDPAPVGSAFGAFALSQLGARPAEAPPADRPPLQHNRPSQNGITRPSAGTQCAKVWDLADALTRHMGRTAPLSTLLSAAMDQGVNQFTARTQYGCWRKFNGITGRIAK